MVGLCYGAFAVASVWLPNISVFLAVAVLAVVIALHSSLQHEVLHGHPFEQKWLSDALIFPAIGLFVPYLRFRETHLAHHQNPNLTDPYDDPESNYMDPDIWERLPGALRLLLRFNNTLAGRMLIGPAVGLVTFYWADLKEVARGNRTVIGGYVAHVLALAPVIWWLSTLAAMPLPAYLAAAYLGMSLLKIRTFLEHQAHEKLRGRTVIIEDRGPLAFLFLNNNLHVVHHAQPAAAWYELPRIFRARRQSYLEQNFGYRYASYLEVFRSHLFRGKDPVPHPGLGSQATSQNAQD